MKTLTMTPGLLLCRDRDSLSMMKFNWPYLTYRTSKTGKRYYYVRKKGCKSVALQDATGTPVTDPESADFRPAYNVALAKLTEQKPKTSPSKPTKSVARAGTIGALILDYQQGAKFNRLKPSTKQSYTRMLNTILEHWEHILARDITPRAVAAFQDKFQAQPRMGDLYVTMLRNLFSLAQRQGLVVHNPASGIEKMHRSTPMKTWGENEIRQAVSGAPEHVGRVYLWLWRTGLRLNDVLRVQRSMINDGVLHITESKTGTSLKIPLHSDLVTDLKSGPERLHHILANSRGRAWTRDGFESSSAKVLKEMFGKERKQIHGIRRLAITSLIEAGCSIPEVSSITGQTAQMVEHYAKDYARFGLAKSAMEKWDK